MRQEMLKENSRLQDEAQTRTRAMATVSAERDALKDRLARARRRRRTFLVEIAGRGLPYAEGGSTETPRDLAAVPSSRVGRGPAAGRHVDIPRGPRRRGSGDGPREARVRARVRGILAAPPRGRG